MFHSKENEDKNTKKRDKKPWWDFFAKIWK